MSGALLEMSFSPEFSSRHFGQIHSMIEKEIGGGVESMPLLRLNMEHPPEIMIRLRHDEARSAVKKLSGEVLKKMFELYSKKNGVLVVEDSNSRAVISETGCEEEFCSCLKKAFSKLAKIENEAVVYEGGKWRKKDRKECYFDEDDFRMYEFDEDRKKWKKR